MSNSINTEKPNQELMESSIKWHIDLPGLKQGILDVGEINQLFSIIGKLKSNGVDLKVNYHKLS